MTILTYDTPDVNTPYEWTLHDCAQFDRRTDEPIARPLADLLAASYRPAEREDRASRWGWEVIDAMAPLIGRVDAIRHGKNTYMRLKNVYGAS